MAQTITIDNFPQFNLMEKGKLTADVAKGAVTLPFSSDINFDDEHAILVGIPGEETTEIALPSVINDDSANVPAIDNAHSQGTPLYKLRGYKARIYRALKVNNACPLSKDAYSLQDTIAIDPAGSETEWTDPTGDSDMHCWVYTFYNDLGDPYESQLDPSEAYSVSDYVVTVAQVRDESGFNDNEYITDAKILEKIRLAQGEANSAAYAGGYTLPFEDTNGVFENAVLLIASGYLMTMDYGLGWQGVNKDGEDKLKKGQALLQGIAKGTTPLVGVEVGVQKKRVRGGVRDSDECNEPWFTRDTKL